ncbi:hypothetical protein I2486_13905 [Cellulophaga sp. E16_2]|uniref:hypothetical protein n=1 Tax=Cellulophaga sp. E16_2 TaxID=2789297 RepID=UPI001A932E70|nr:hypothetical protein [Cellulophaga sp. E16_2]MBO0592496.1 hypothetical protein [Cellulophaga sp. E16_2]
MKKNKMSLLKLLFLFLFYSISCINGYAQNDLYSLSFKANQENYNDSYCSLYYNLEKEGHQYILTNPKGINVLKKKYDTILYTPNFIKAILSDSISIYKTCTLEEIKIPELKEVYFIKDGLEVLTATGPHYYDNSISKINAFPEPDLFSCGTVYSTEYSIKYLKDLKKYVLIITKGNFGPLKEKITLHFKGIPDAIDSLSFLDGGNYISVSVNTQYKKFPNHIKIIRYGKSEIYYYDFDKAIYQKSAKEKPDYFISKSTKDTIFFPLVRPSNFSKEEGSVTLERVTPEVYHQIEQNTIDHLIYLYSDDQIGIFPQHLIPDFNQFSQKTNSFYRITKNGKEGWLDIKTFKEFYNKE